MSAPDLSLSYGPLPEHVVDVRLPAATGQPAPLVVVVHGGFWKAEWDRAHAAPQSAGLAAAGYVVATVEYRRVGMPGGGWPGTLDDVALLADTVPALVARRCPASGSTRARTVLVGHSAGGHLVGLVGRPAPAAADSPWHRPTPLPVGVVSLAGVLDLGAGRSASGSAAGATDALLGGRAATSSPERYAVADPAAAAAHRRTDRRWCTAPATRRCRSRSAGPTRRGRRGR